jgi:alkylation response protein AidB-like acyl-CoA dehydrogenase
MNAQPNMPAMQQASAALRERLRALGPSLRAQAADDDARGSFPVAGFAALRTAGLMQAVLSTADGGIGLGWEAPATATLVTVLQSLGAAHLALARLYEGHVNAFALLWRHGYPGQRRRLVAYVREGGLLAVWNAPSPRGPLRIVDGAVGQVLAGEKIYASGAGHVARPLVTATDAHGHLLMLWPDASHASVDLTGWQVHGMRASLTGTVTFDGIAVAADDRFGAHDDYHAQPAFSAGAWRFLAAQLGAAGELHDLTRQALLDAGRVADPHQRARLADAAIAIEGARLLVGEAAARAEAGDGTQPVAAVVAYVGMARLAVERTALDVIELAQRSVGLRAMMQASPMERVMRDLATYLRQPVPDAIRDGVAGAVLAADGPALERWLP